MSKNSEIFMLVFNVFGGVYCVKLTEEFVADRWEWFRGFGLTQRERDSRKLTPCIALYDTMQSLQTHIATHFLGQAYNLAAFPWRKDGE
ncbi:endopeptidase Clp [Trifolium repens]|nr:endopeptidase Clp [Trifolium repens]WJX57973.1 endopeptidase Clp [Trifolium repens]